jgi:hypothetical protein
MKCVGNCALCENVDAESKQACCSVQTLKNIVEVKSLLIEIRNKISEESPVLDVFSNLPDIDSEPTVVGAEKE